MKKEAIQKLYSKYQIIIFPALVGLSGIALIVLVIIPQIRGYFKSQEDAQGVRDRLEVLEVKAKDLENLPEEALRQKLQSAVSALPTTKDYTSVIGLIQRLSADSGVVLNSVNLNTGRGAGLAETNSFSVDVSITATSFSFDEFLKKIEDSPTVLKVSSINLNSGGGLDSVSASVVIDVFFSPTPKNLGSVETPLPKLSEEEEQLALELESRAALVPVSTAVPSLTGETPVQPPANLLPRGKANPFE